MAEFTSEIDDHYLRGSQLERKICERMISNGYGASNSSENNVETIAHGGDVIASLAGSQQDVSAQILSIIDVRLINH